MKICFVSFEYPPNVWGGAGTYAKTLVEGLRRRGVDTFVISRSIDRSGDQHDEHQRTFRVPASDSVYWRRLFFIELAMSLFHKLSSGCKFDLVHFNEPHIILEKPKLPTVCTFHSSQVNEINSKRAYSKTLNTATDIRDLILKGSVGSLCDVLVAHSTDEIICPSAHLAKLIKSYCLVDDRRVHVVPNGIDLQAIDKIRDYDTGILTEHSLEKDKYVLFMGRLSVLKGVQYLINAFRTIKKEYSDLKLVIVGTGRSENYLRNLAHGIEDVVFTGYIDLLADKKLLYENCLAVAVPSLYEGLPMVVLEAMACRKVVIGSDVGGIPTLIKHGKNGFLVKPEDSKSIEKFIRTLLEDANLREKMGSFGRRLVEEEFTVDRMVDKTLKVYESLF
jgi:glycosyltransferase involved in cell wall biosynthesis